MGYRMQNPDGVDLNCISIPMNEFMRYRMQNHDMFAGWILCCVQALISACNTCFILVESGGIVSLHSNRYILMCKGYKNLCIQQEKILYYCFTQKIRQFQRVGKQELCQIEK